MDLTWLLQLLTRLRRRGESIYWHAFSVHDELLMFDHGRGAGSASSGDDLTGPDDDDEDLRLALLMSMRMSMQQDQAPLAPTDASPGDVAARWVTSSQYLQCP